jgi:fumarate hydratase, class I
MEAIYEFDVQDMPVTVAVDSSGESVHTTGPKRVAGAIGKIPVVSGRPHARLETAAQPGSAA